MYKKKIKKNKKNKKKERKNEKKGNTYLLQASSVP